ncbi:MAG: PEP/pyruvate-binding domain-containing protein [Thermotogota bacterium]|nr:PEP/pyruvate-binding domain-containing protein [Thermotogota bacterium]
MRKRFCGFVYSSADAEDSPKSSYAGQFESVLNLKGSDQILSALETVAKSVLSVNVNTYSEKMNLGRSVINMSMIVQRQISPVFSGVLFTKNPVNGFDEIIIEATEGFSDKILQG